MSAFRAGVVCLVGKPNVGKSTLLNALVGQKLAIVSDKPQTTRRKLLGITTTDKYQVAFVDTPGLHEAHTELGRILNDAVKSALTGVDVVLAVADVSRSPGKPDEMVAKLLVDAPVPRVLCLNKMDLLKPIDVQDHVEQYSRLFQTEEYMLVCATKRINLDKLLDLVVAHLPESGPLYDPDEITDQPLRVLAAELIREKALQLTRQEVPHAIATMVDSWEEESPRPGVPGSKGLVRIHASLICERESQKAILIGKGGSMLKQIGTLARSELEEWTGKPVYLQLFVKVRPNWRQNPRMLRDLSYR